VLRELKKHFEVIMFTSSSRIYCDGIMKNVIETDGETFFDHKLFKNHLFPPKVYSNYSRFHLDNTQIKNLDILKEGRDMKSMVIIDNRSANYCDHVLNGIPISDYNGEPNDEGLLKMFDYIMARLLPADDLQQIVKEDFLDAVITAKKLQVLPPQQKQILWQQIAPCFGGKFNPMFGGGVPFGKAELHSPPRLTIKDEKSSRTPNIFKDPPPPINQPDN
jgi:hypothetical protein